MTSFPAFEILFINYPLSVWGIVYSTTATNTIFIAIGLNLIIHIKILQRKFTKINKQTTKLEMQKLVDYHNEILYYYKMFHNFFYDLTFIVINDIKLLICFLVFRAGTVS